MSEAHTSRSVVMSACLIATAASFFTLGVIHAQRSDAVAQRFERQSEVRKMGRSEPVPAATVGRPAAQKDEALDIPAPAARARMVAEIKQEIQNEMGLLPVHLLRERRSSFVELYAYDNDGKTSYGTAGYLGGGYFVTVKHAVVALLGDNERRIHKIMSVKVVLQRKGNPGPRHRHRRCRHRGPQRRLGDHQDERARPAGASHRHVVRL
jgi:hypothetical protein